MVLLQIYFRVSNEKAGTFERFYKDVYVPALRKQKGYQHSNLLRVYPPQVAQEIDASNTEYNYQMELIFDIEENRRHWAGSADHSIAWPQAVQLAEHVAWRGYDIADSDVGD